MNNEADTKPGTTHSVTVRFSERLGAEMSEQAARYVRSVASRQGTVRDVRVRDFQTFRNGGRKLATPKSEGTVIVCEIHGSKNKALSVAAALNKAVKDAVLATGNVASSPRASFLTRNQLFPQVRC